MFFKILIISTIAVAFFIFALGINFWLNNKKEVKSPACEFEGDPSAEQNTCSACKIKEIVNCSKEQQGN
jgi:hypothetical protein